MSAAVRLPLLLQSPVAAQGALPQRGPGTHEDQLASYMHSEDAQQPRASPAILQSCHVVATFHTAQDSARLVKAVTDSSPRLVSELGVVQLGLLFPDTRIYFARQEQGLWPAWAVPQGLRPLA